MTILEMILLVCGIVCVVVSFIFSGKKEKSEELTQEVKAEPRELTEQEKQRIRQQIDGVIDEQLQDLTEKTEAQLDRISNTKILEMNDYAETVINEINRNHNETVFLYDMLNEKAKEVKTTVKDVNIAKKEVAKLQDDITLNQNYMAEKASGLKAEGDDGISAANDEDWTSRVERAEKAALAQIISDGGSVAADGSKQPTSSADKASIDESNKTEVITEMYKSGMTIKNIAKKLNLGVGEVKLVIDLSKNAR